MPAELDNSKKLTSVTRVFTLFGILGSAVAMLFCAWIYGATRVSTWGIAPTSMQTNPYAAGLIASAAFFIFSLGWHTWIDFME